MPNFPSLLIFDHHDKHSKQFRCHILHNVLIGELWPIADCSDWSWPPISSALPLSCNARDQIPQCMFINCVNLTTSYEFSFTASLTFPRILCPKWKLQAGSSEAIS